MKAVFRGLLRCTMRIYLTIACCNATASEYPPDSHAAARQPSPDWSEQILYFLMLDRFNDGDSTNNDQGAGEYDANDPAKYHGGDLAGVREKLDYIQELGATAIWITPPVANQWWDGSHHYGGYHGYWASDFKAVDAHYGRLEDYRALAEALHRRGMYLVQDIVLNHMGNFFSIAQGDGKVQNRYRKNPDSRPLNAPSQYPFTQNDPRDPEQRSAAIYHWTPDIDNPTDRNQELTYQLAGLDDLNTENPRVRRALRDSYDYWIREVGVDGFRVDTAFYLPPDFFRDFLYSNDKTAPGVIRYAKTLGKSHFHVFGEGFGIDSAFEDSQARKIERYMRDPAGKPLMPGMLNFPLYGSLGAVFGRGAATAELAWRIEDMMRVHAHPELMPSFIDNHDVDRFLNDGAETGLKQALLAILTLPGIPTIYYGTEQGFRVQRAAMFKSEAGGEKHDHFNADAPLYRFLKEAIALRKNHPVFAHGKPRILASSRHGPGALAYEMRDGKRRVWVMFNTAAQPVLLDGLKADAGRDTILLPLYHLGEVTENPVFGADGTLNLVLPPGSVGIWELSDEPAGASPAPAPDKNTVRAPSITAAMTGPVSSAHLNLSGHWNSERAYLVVDGLLAEKPAVIPTSEGQWHAVLPLAGLKNSPIPHRVLLWEPKTGQVSPAYEFRVAHPWKRLRVITDPPADDSGPNGRYRYPQESSWKGIHPGDIRRVEIARAGPELRLDIEFQDLVARWHPPQGFDHLVLTGFIELPETAGGERHMPQQHALLPSDMRWHYRFRVNGWNKALFSAEGATADEEGQALGLHWNVVADAGRKRLRITLPAALFEHAGSLAGARLYLNTWDYDGGYKPLTAGGGPQAFSGGNGQSAPLFIDDTAIIRLP